MQRARCCAANAYDATAAFHAVFGRAPTPRHLSRVSSVRNELYSQGRGVRRSYGTDTEDARQRDVGASAADAPTPIDSRSRKLAFYEELMAKEKTTTRARQPEHEPKEQKNPPKEEQVDVGGPWDARPGLSLLGEPLWKVKMMELSQHVRESRLVKSQETPEGEENSERPPTLDYKGVAIRPEISKVRRRRRPPWAITYDRNTAEYTAAQILDAEIKAFAKFMSPTEEEQVVREALRRNIRHIIKSDPNNSEVVTYHFGSTRTGLTMPYSDVDIGVYHSDRHRDTLEEPMERLYQNLLDGNDFMLVVHRPPPNAIITAQHKATGIDVQVIAKGVPGKQTKMTFTYLREIPNFHELYAVVRTAFGTRGLVDPFIGGYFCVWRLHNAGRGPDATGRACRRSQRSINIGAVPPLPVLLGQIRHDQTRHLIRRPLDSKGLRQDTTRHLPCRQRITPQGDRGRTLGNQKFPVGRPAAH